MTELPDIPGPMDDITELRAEFSEFRNNAYKAGKRRDIIIGLLLMAMILGVVVIVGIITSRDTRRRENDNKFNDIACLGLAYIPSGAPAAEKARAEFTCPPVADKDKHTPTSRSSTPSSTPVSLPTGLSVPRSYAKTVVVPAPTDRVSRTPSDRSAASPAPEMKKPRSTSRGGRSNGASTTAATGPSPTTVREPLCVLGLVCVTVPPLIGH